MTVASNETDSTRLLAEAPCEDSTANLISKQARERPFGFVRMTST